MFNPFITPGQLQLKINQEITRSIRSQGMPPIGGPNNLHNCNQGVHPLMTAALSQLLINTFRNY